METLKCFPSVSYHNFQLDSLFTRCILVVPDSINCKVEGIHFSHLNCLLLLDQFFQYRIFFISVAAEEFQFIKSKHSDPHLPEISRFPRNEETRLLEPCMYFLKFSSDQMCI